MAATRTAASSSAHEEGSAVALVLAMSQGRFVGMAWSEARLLALGHAFETLTRHRRPPTFAARTPPP